MAKCIFRLRGVPEDESDEVRELLDGAGLEYYETPAGNWGISSPGLWVRDPAQAERARLLIDEYQAARARRERERYAALKARGEQPRLRDALRRQPLRVLGLLLFAAVIAYFSVAPFIAIE